MTKKKPPETEEMSYACEAIWQICPDVKLREDGNVLLTPAQCEVLLRRFGWRAPCDARKGRHSDDDEVLRRITITKDASGCA